MGTMIAALLSLVGAWLVAFVYRLVRDHYVLAELKRSNGCMEPTKYPHMDPFLGLDLFLAMSKAMKHGRMLETNIKLFETYGRTFQFSSWGTDVITTREPKNIQTVLSLAFDNFGVEPVNSRKTGGSFMAKGIFTADGPIWARSRALIRPTFARPQISNFASLEGHVNNLFHLMPRDESIVDLQPFIKRLVWLHSPSTFLEEDADCHHCVTTVSRYLDRILVRRIGRLSVAQHTVQINAISQKL